MLRSSIIVIGMLITVCLASFMNSPGTAYPEKLSAWKIFEGKMNSLKPAIGFVPYQLNSPLFSDYAEKLRFVKLPAGSSVKYNSGKVLDFPTGTLLVKTFYYSADNRQPGQHKNIIETRLLINEPGGWKAITYVWNDDQTDAELEIAGDDKQVSFTNADGNTQQVRYVVPNQNQCKGCHNVNDKILPIGPSAGQLNGLYQYASGSQNQIEYWSAHGMLRQVAKSGWPKTPVWNDPLSGSLDARARAYLEVNCAHCHRKEGPAQTSGLYLTESEKDLNVWGINKPPVAAGKGSGGRMVDILPGDAGASILWYRMQATDPGERMPELGRNLVHKEGVALIKQWIDKMK